MLNDDKAKNLKDALEAGYSLLTSSRAGLMYQNEYRGNLTTDSRETLFSVVPIGACTYRHMSDDDVFHLNVNTPCILCRTEERRNTNKALL